MLGGVRHGLTLGGPLALIVRNRDHANWGAAMSAWPVTEEELAEVAARRSRKVLLPRPGHADLSGRHEVRAGRRAQRARARVGARDLGPRRGRRDREGPARAARDRGLRAGARRRRRRGGARTRAMRRRSNVLGRARSAVRIPQPRRACSPRSTRRRPTRDTLGGIIEIRAFGCPPGLGSHTEPRLRLDARLAAAAVGIQAMKGVEIGDGVRERAPAGLGGARRAALRRRARLLARDEPRRRDRGRHVERRAADRARRDEAAADAHAAAALGAPRHARGGRGAGRAQRHHGDRRSRRGGRGGRRVRARALRAREVRRRLRRTT